jgi:hypothetical protein
MPFPDRITARPGRWRALAADRIGRARVMRAGQSAVGRRRSGAVCATRLALILAGLPGRY